MRQYTIDNLNYMTNNDIVRLRERVPALVGIIPDEFINDPRAFIAEHITQIKSRILEEYHGSGSEVIAARIRLAMKRAKTAAAMAAHGSSAASKGARGAASIQDRLDPKTVAELLAMEEKERVEANAKVRERIMGKEARPKPRTRKEKIAEKMQSRVGRNKAIMANVELIEEEVRAGVMGMVRDAREHHRTAQARAIFENFRKDPRAWVETVLTRENSKRAIGSLKNAPKGVKLAMGLVAALGAAAIVNRVVVSNSTPPSGAQAAWTRIEQLQKSDLTEERRKTFTDFGSPINPINIGVFAGKSSTVGDIIAKAFSKEALPGLASIFESGKGPATIARRLTRMGPEGLKYERKKVIDAWSNLGHINALELSRPRPIGIPTANWYNGMNRGMMSNDYKLHPSFVAHRRKIGHRVAGPARHERDMASLFGR